MAQVKNSLLNSYKIANKKSTLRGLLFKSNVIRSLTKSLLANDLTPLTVHAKTATLDGGEINAQKLVGEINRLTIKTETDRYAYLVFIGRGFKKVQFDDKIVAK